MKNLVALAIVSTALMAGPVQAELQHGFEVGARAGYVWTNGANLNVSAKTLATNVVDPFSNKRLSDNGGTAGLFAGYNWLCNQLLLGMDVSADWLNADDSHASQKLFKGADLKQSARLERDFMYGLSGRMGYKAFDFMTPFVRLGIERANNKLGYDLDLVNNPAAPVRQLGVVKSRHKTGYLVGLGTDIPVFNKHTNVRVEYQYHWQNRANFDLGNTIDNTTSFHANIKPKAHFLTVGLVWSQV